MCMKRSASRLKGRDGSDEGSGDAMGSGAQVTQTTRAGQDRAALSVGLSVSVVVHIAALIVVTVPGAGPGDLDAPRKERPTETFDAIEVVELSQTVPPMVPSPAPRPTASTAGATAEIPTAGGETDALEARFAGIAPAQLALNLPQSGRPVVTLRDIDLISDDEALMDALYRDLLSGTVPLESSGSGLGGLLSSIGSALSGGGHCPTPITSSGSQLDR